LNVDPGLGLIFQRGNHGEFFSVQHDFKDDFGVCFGAFKATQEFENLPIIVVTKSQLIDRRQFERSVQTDFVETLERCADVDGKISGFAPTGVGRHLEGDFLVVQRGSECERRFNTIPFGIGLKLLIDQIGVETDLTEAMERCCDLHRDTWIVGHWYVNNHFPIVMRKNGVDITVCQVVAAHDRQCFHNFKRRFQFEWQFGVVVDQIQADALTRSPEDDDSGSGSFAGIGIQTPFLYAQRRDADTGSQQLALTSRCGGNLKLHGEIDALQVEEDFSFGIFQLELDVKGVFVLGAGQHEFSRPLG